MSRPSLIVVPESYGRFGGPVGAAQRDDNDFCILQVSFQFTAPFMHYGCSERASQSRRLLPRRLPPTMQASRLRGGR